MYLFHSNILFYVSENWKLLLFLSSIYGLHYYVTCTFDFFKKKGVSYIQPTYLVGSVWKRLSNELSYHEFQLYVYNYFKGKPFGGIFEGRRPILYILDQDIIKAITIRAFDHFVDRNSLHNNGPRNLQRNLNKLKGSEWKAVRNTLTPLFSSTRLKNMMPLIQQNFDQMVKFLEQYEKSDVEIKSLISRLTLEVIGACAFGIKTDALTDNNARFVEISKTILYLTPLQRIIVMFFCMVCPKLLRFVKVTFLNPDVVSELLEILKVTKAERRQADSMKSDFLQLMINVSKKEMVEAEKTNAEIQMDDDTIDATSIFFVLAGYDTSSTALTYGIHMLAVKPDVQEKLREHILEVTNGREITYEVLSELTYLEGFFFEIMRIKPPVSNIERLCTKEYILPGTNVKIDVGDIVTVPSYGIHMDPDIYPEPHKFRPERFMGNEKKNRPTHLYLAFGSGPRNCIGIRFVMMSLKMAMVSLLKKYKFSTCAKTENPLKDDRHTIVLKPANEIWLKLEKI